MKELAVVVAGQPEARDIEVQPGNTPTEVLNKLGLTGYRLRREASDQWFGDNENIYPSCLPGEKLLAAMPNVVGSRETPLVVGL